MIADAAPGRPEPGRPAPFLRGFLTLKNRIVLVIAAGALFPYLLAAVISYFAINSILTNKLQSGVQSNLRQITLSLENAINNVNHISQQLAFEGYVGNMLEEYLGARDTYSRAALRKSIEAELNLIAFTNPNVGLIMYYFETDGVYDFETAGVREGFSPARLPLLAAYYGITYYGPHPSNDRFSSTTVLSAMRKVELPGRDDVSVYIETGFRLTQSILDSDVTGRKTLHLLLGNDGRVAYSEVPSLFPTGSTFPDAQAGSSAGAAKGYSWVRETTNQGWSVVSLIPTAELNRERNQWLGQMAAVFLILILAIMLLAWFLGRMVYRPLDRLTQEIRAIEQNDFQSEPQRTRIPEFDSLLLQFQRMKRQILELLGEIETKEKRRADLEIEKLLYQINPHFLMNALNTVHWLAVANGQTEIDQLALSLNKLLYYNLGKTGQNTDLGAELDALKEYFSLQKIRYDFRYEVAVHGPEDVLRTRVPRFILQPLAENAIHHGLRENGTIRVKVERGQGISISVSDDGPGMPLDTVRQVLGTGRADDQKQGMGIGLHYVRRVLDSYYGGRARLDIRSSAGEGTVVTLRLPPGDGPA